MGKIILEMEFYTKFKCMKCGYQEATEDEKGNSKEWLKHCGAMAEMIGVRSYINK